MSSMSDLRLDWCSYDAAKFACKNWHYSKCVPAGKTLKIGVWEYGEFIGAIIYSRGANANIASEFGFTQTEVCELTRVALNDHDSPVSQMLSISRKLLTDRNAGMELVVSYADPQENHHGGIYQADNWYYIGHSEPQSDILINGDEHHKNSVHRKYGTASVKKLQKKYPKMNIEYGPKKYKYKYVYPLSNVAKRKIKDMAKPYP